MDFSEAALDAAIVALDLLSAPAELAHVYVNTLGAPESGSDQAVMPRHIHLLFTALPKVARQRPSVAVTSHCLSGSRVTQLVQFAASWGAELLAVGGHGHRPSTATIDRPFGPTVLGLLESAPCTLVVSRSA